MLYLNNYRKKLRVNCKECVIKAVCSYICDKERLLVKDILIKLYKRFINRMNITGLIEIKKTGIYFDYFIADEKLIKGYKHCPVCNNRYCYSPSISFLICSYCQMRISYDKKDNVWFINKLLDLDIGYRNFKIKTYKDVLKLIDEEIHIQSHT